MKLADPGDDSSFAAQTVAGLIMAFLAVVISVGAIAVLDWLYHAAVPLH